MANLDVSKLTDEELKALLSEASSEDLTRKKAQLEEAVSGIFGKIKDYAHLFTSAHKRKLIEALGGTATNDTSSASVSAGGITGPKKFLFNGVEWSGRGKTPTLYAGGQKPFPLNPAWVAANPEEAKKYEQEAQGQVTPAPAKKAVKKSATKKTAAKKTAK